MDELSSTLIVVRRLVTRVEVHRVGGIQLISDNSMTVLIVYTMQTKEHQQIYYFLSRCLSSAIPVLEQY